MKILHRYLAKDYLVVFGMTLAVFTFVMYIGAVIKAIDLMARGVEGAVILKIFAHNIPYILSFSIPISSLTAVLLVFSRLSFDGEITAMKACGLSMPQICAPIILLAALLSLVCIYINAYAAPDSHFARRTLLHEVGIEDPVDLLQEGVYVRDFPGVIIYVASKSGEKVQDVIVHELDAKGLKRTIRAESGRITVDEEAEEFVVDLHKVRIDTAPNDPDAGDYHYIAADDYQERLDYGSLRNRDTVEKRRRDLTLPELAEAIRHPGGGPGLLDAKAQAQQRMAMQVETSQRFAMSFCCVAFALLGVPLGMKSKRRESSVGVLISLVVVFAFYFFVILAQSLDDHPHLRPDLIIWLPLLAAQIVGLWLIARQD